MSIHAQNVRNLANDKVIFERSQNTNLLRTWASCVTVSALLIWTIIVWVHFARIVIRFHSPLPYWDYWDTVPKIEHYRHLNIGVLWQQHNEHRIVFPEVVFAADYLFFRGQEILPAAFSACLYFGTWLILSAALYRTKSPLFPRLCGILLSGVVMGWEGGAFQIASPFLLQWSLMLSAAALALFLLTRVPGSRRPWIYLSAVIACSAVSTYSSANGLFFWPVILLAAWIVRLTKHQFIVLAASAAILISLYFVGYRPSHDTHPSVLLTQPFYAICFIAAYLGMPFTVIAPKLGISAGLFQLIVYMALIGLAARRRLVSTRAGVVLFGFYLVCLFTAVLTALGRMNPQDPTFDAATAHRYVIVPLAAHAALILAAGWVLGIFSYHLWFPIFGVFTLGFAATGRSVSIRSWVDVAKDRFANCQLASVAFESNVDDTALMKSVFPGPNYVRELLPVLRKYHVSVFGRGNVDWLGRSALSTFRFISNHREAGAVTAVIPVESGLMVLGWTDSPRKIRHPQELVFLNEKQEIVGFGRKLPAGLPRNGANFETPQSIAWAGFLNLSFQSKSFSPYTVWARGRAITPVGEPVEIPPVRVSRAEEMGAAITPIVWTVQGTWTQNGHLPVPPENMPPATSYYESWSGADANTGVLASVPFAKPSGNCLILSGAHGPSIAGLSEKLINADNNETIASVTPVGGDTSWRFWSIDLPPNAKHLRILAEDRGSGWGEWMAIGEPHLCK